VTTEIHSFLCMYDNFNKLLENIACSAVNIRNPQVHVPLSLADTCQLCVVSLKEGRTTYIAVKRDCARARSPLLLRWASQT
jgi:hypothetical protein